MTHPMIKAFSLYLVLLAAHISGPVGAHGACADLSFEFTGPGAARAGDVIGSVLAGFIENSGDSKSGALDLKFFLSSEFPLADESGVLIGDTKIDDGVPPGSRRDVGVPGSMAIPADTLPGEYHLFMVVGEPSPRAGCAGTSVSLPLPLTILPTNAPGDCPDLFIEFTAPGEADRGEEIGSRITAAVTNGGGVFSEELLVHFYLSREPKITASGSFLIGISAIPPGGISPGGTVIVETGDKIIVPPDIPPGAYYMVAEVDEPNIVAECDETNNTRSAPITIVALCPDLAVEMVTTLENAPPGPLALEPGQVIGDLVHAVVTNLGNRDVQTFQTGFYLTGDPHLSPSDIPLLNGRETEPFLAPGGTVRVDPPLLRIPEGVPAGNYYLGALVDDAGDIEECDEENNIAGIPVRIVDADCSAPDLRSEIVDYAFGRVGSIITGRVSLNVFNEGKSPSGSFSIAAHLSEDETLDPEDPLLEGGIGAVGELAPGESVLLDLSGAFEQPEEDPVPDTVFLIVTVDPSNRVEECNELNNRETALLCESPLVTEDLKLILPRVMHRDEPDAEPFRMEFDLIPWNGGAAFELSSMKVDPPGKEAGFCGNTDLTLAGTVHIPRVRFTTTGIVILAMDLRLVTLPLRTMFEIISIEILPSRELPPPVD